jgi:hypothetical protein
MKHPVEEVAKMRQHLGAWGEEGSSFLEEEEVVEVVLPFPFPVVVEVVAEVLVHSFDLKR